MKKIKTIVICLAVALLFFLLTSCDTRNKGGTSLEAWRNDPLVSSIEEIYQANVDTFYRQSFLVHFRVAYPHDKLYGLYNPMSQQFFSADEPFVVKIIDPFLFVSDDGGKKWLPMTNDGYWVSREAAERAYIINPHQRDYGVLTYSYLVWELRLPDDDGILQKCKVVPEALISAVSDLAECDTLSYQF